MSAEPLFALHDRARERGIEGYRRMSRDELVAALGEAPAEAAPPAEPPRAVAEDAPAATPEPPPPPQPPVHARTRPRTRVDASADGPLGVLRLDGAGPETTLALETLEELALGAARLAADPDVRVVAVTGAGRIFSAGADLEAIRGLTGAEVSARGTAACDALAALPVPTVALLNGHAVGGAVDLALACDWRAAVPAAKLRFIHTELGYSPPWGGARRLPAIVPPGRALRAFALADTLTAAEAHAAGIVDAVVEPDALLDHARALAARVAHAGRDAVAQTKRLLREVSPHEHEATFARLWDGAKVRGDGGR